MKISGSYIEKFIDSYQTLPQIEKGKVKILWDYDYYDGSLNGVCEFEGKKCWFSIVADWYSDNDPPENDPNFRCPWYRRYLIHYLTETQYQKLQEKNDKFIAAKNSNSINQYFEEDKLEESIDIVPFNDSHIVGWFEL